MSHMQSDSKHPVRNPLLLPMMKKLAEKHIRFTIPNQHQIKVGPYNFYPARGKIVIDNVGLHSECGEDAFLELIESVKRKAVSAGTTRLPSGHRETTGDDEPRFTGSEGGTR